MQFILPFITFIGHQKVLVVSKQTSNNKIKNSSNHVVQIFLFTIKCPLIYSPLFCVHQVEFQTSTHQQFVYF